MGEYIVRAIFEKIVKGIRNKVLIVIKISLCNENIKGLSEFLCYFCVIFSAKFIGILIKCDENQMEIER